MSLMFVQKHRCKNFSGGGNMEKQRGGKRKGAGRKKEFKDRGNFMGYNYEKDEVIRMKENVKNYMNKYKLKTTTEFIRKIFLDEIEKLQRGFCLYNSLKIIEFYNFIALLRFFNVFREFKTKKSERWKKEKFNENIALNVFNDEKIGV